MTMMAGCIWDGDTYSISRRLKGEGMKMPVAIRMAAIEDADSISAYMSLIADENLDTVSRRRPTPEQAREFVGGALAQERAFVLLAVDVSIVVGLLDLWAGRNEHDRHSGHFGMSVRRDYRNKGIGRQLVQMAINTAWAWQGFCRIGLEVVSWNAPAIHLYESIGFQREGVRRSAVNFRGKPEDVILMWLVRPTD